MKTRLIAVALCVGLSACANNYVPPIDPGTSMHGADNAQFQSDLSYCRQLSKSENVVQKSVIGGGIGSLIGAGLGSVIADKASRGAWQGAGLGAALGAGVNAWRGNEEQKRIIRNCMSNRGWSTL